MYSPPGVNPPDTLALRYELGIVCTQFPFSASQMYTLRTFSFENATIHLPLGDTSCRNGLSFRQAPGRNSSRRLAMSHTTACEAGRRLPLRTPLGPRPDTNCLRALSLGRRRLNRSTSFHSSVSHTKSCRRSVRTNTRRGSPVGQSEIGRGPVRAAVVVAEHHSLLPVPLLELVRTRARCRRLRSDRIPRPEDSRQRPRSRISLPVSPSTTVTESFLSNKRTLPSGR